MPHSNAHIVLNSRDATSGTYNSTQYNAINQNIIQGNIDRIGLNEINFPYDIPNIQTGLKGPGSAGSTNIFYLNLLDVAGGTVEYSLEVVLPIGFYTGSELADAINSAIIAAATEDDIPTPAANVPVCNYVQTSNVFAFGPPPAPSAPMYNGVWQFTSPYTFPTDNPTTNTLGKDIFSLMGYQKGQNPLVDTNVVPGAAQFPFIAAAAASLAFTQYIDICSPQLCKFQYFRDGSTTNLARRSDVICRVYIANDIAIAQSDPEGTRPFVIHRQFKNPRMMKWTADNAVGTIDIQLYDDVGQLLAYKWLPRNFQLTFNAYEGGDDSSPSDKSDNDAPPKHGAYTNKNAKAWKNLKQFQ
jgi:hypothetical protein